MTRRKPGPKTNISKSGQSMTMVLPSEMIDDLDVIAQDRDITRTALMKEILTEYLSNIKKDK